MKIFHMRLGRFGRAFATDYTFWQSIILWARGWRRDLFFNGNAYTKPSKNQAVHELTEPHDEH